MRLAIMTPQRPQSEMLIRRLVQFGITPSLVLYHQKPEVSGISHIKKSLKASIRSILFRARASERVRRVRLSNEREARFFLEEYARTHGLDRDQISLNALHHISRVNDDSTADLLRSHQIDVLFIWGVPIIRPNIIGSVRSMVINAHSSILPEYRGAKSEFWQCFHQDFKHAGVSLHQVDVGVDTGDILMQVKADPLDCVNPERLRVSNAIRVIEGLPSLLEAVKSGSYRRVLQSDLSTPKTPTYRVKDVGIEHLSKVYLGVDVQSVS
jgi:folate-dependent phosphoribosylglycinamide formyltransferase PurN